MFELVASLAGAHVVWTTRRETVHTGGSAYLSGTLFIKSDKMRELVLHYNS
jgi:hypothetical protein